jgi:tape measure domain-containing protein
MSEINSIFPQDEDKKLRDIDAALSKLDQTLLKFSDDLDKSSKNISFVTDSIEKLKKAQEGAEQQSIKIDQIVNKISENEKKLSKSINDATKAIIAQERAKQAKINTDNKVIDQIKKEQQALNLETQGRIKNAQQIAAEERAKQAKIRTDKLEMQGIQKKTSAFKGLITSLRNYLVLYVSISQLTQLAKNIFNTTRNLDALDFSMKKVITDQREFAQTQEFLSKITDSYGAELIATTERYIKFRAAAQQSNLTAKDTQQIFGSMTKIAGTLGLSTDELTGVYLALEQMLSKGKVTTEELRRQLGERIPGAFGIMAKAVQVLNPNMEVTISSLDKMLKSGSVISAEVLPEFARQAEKAFGVENITRVDTLAAAQNRYKIAWQETVKAMQASDFFLTVLEKATNILKGIRDGFSGINEELIRGKSESEIYANNLIALSERAGDQARYEAIKNGLNSENIALKQNQAIVESLTQSIDKQKQSAASLADQLKNKDPEAYAVLSNSINNYRGQLSKQFELVKDFVNESTVMNYDQRKQSALAIKDLILQSNAIEILKGKVIELNQAEKENKIATETDAQYKKRIKLSTEAKEKELFEFELLQQQKIALQSIALDELYSERDKNAEQAALYEAALDESDYNNKVELIDKKIELQKKLLSEVKDGSTEQVSILSNIAKLEMQIEKEKSDFIINENANSIKIRKAQNKQFFEERRQLTDQTISNSEAIADEEILSAQETTIKFIELAKGKADQIKDIEDKLALWIIDKDIEAQQRILDTAGLEVGAYDAASRKLRALLIERKKEEINQTKETEEEKRRIREEYAKLAIDIASEIGTAIFDIRNANLEYELSVLEKEKEAKLKSTTETEAGKAYIERFYDEQAAKIKEKQAKNDKAQALFNIAINTAQGVISALAMLPPNFPLSIAIGVIGAVQAASVLAQPIPKFAKGTKDAPMKGIFGEAGGELMQTTTGKLIYADSPTYFEGNQFKGATIFTSKETERIINQTEHSGFSGRTMTDERILKGLAGVERAIRNKPVAIYDEAHRTIGYQSGNHKEIYWNRITRRN